MRIAQLRYFVTVAQLENVSQAAELLHLSQSSLSKNIATLETELGMPLFYRNGRRLTLNSAGARLLEFSTMVLRELDYVMDDMRLLAFREIRPDAEFEITAGIEGLEHLEINVFDMLIYPAGLKYGKFNGYPLYEERYSLAAAARNPLTKNPSLRPKTLEGQDVIFLRSGHAAEEYPFQICSALALNFRSISYADSREFHRQMIADGLCVGFVPTGCDAFYRGEGEIRLIPIQDRRFSRQMMVCFRREKTLSPFIREFRDFVLNYYSVDTDRQIRGQA